MNNLYILIGAPGCGKSIWAQEKKALGWSVVSRDEIRYAYLKNNEAYFSHEKEVFDTFVNALAASILSNKNTVADATHLNESSRAKLLQALAAKLPSSSYNIIFIYSRSTQIHNTFSIIQLHNVFNFINSIRN